jgi:hypothetical protein
MMRMLDAGGIPALTDRRRAADQHNPGGYFEDDRALRLARDSSWIEEARGKAVKIIYRLLRYLPPRHDYRVLFMERDLHEVYDSQQEMLEERKDPAMAQDRGAIIRALSLDLRAVQQWLSGQPNIRSLPVPYRDLINDANVQVSGIARFLDGDLDEAAMASAIDPALYRHRR